MVVACTLSYGLVRTSTSSPARQPFCARVSYFATPGMDALDKAPMLCVGMLGNGPRRLF